MEVLRSAESEEYDVIDTYVLIEPWAKARILEHRKTRAKVYDIVEDKMTDRERSIYDNLMRIIQWELQPTDGKQILSYEAAKDFLIEQIRRIVRIYSARMGAKAGDVNWQRVLYYLLRNTVGYGPLEPIMRDPYVEDISCDGLGKPIYVWHQRYESMPTTLIFNDEEELDSLVLKLAHMAGRHISVAFPIVDAMLPGGHRLAATFRKEVSVGGSTFTIRKFREKPLSIVDLVLQRSLNSQMAAYMWMLMESKMPGIIMGVTGSGKTTMLNAIATLLRPTIKVVTIEDTPELRLTLENWVQLVSRHSYSVTGSKVGEVTLYDLVKVSLRYRPDVIIVGEIRGEEAYVLFQAIATGHGGLTTMHAESVSALVRRLTSPPMNIPPSYVPLMRWAILVKRVVTFKEGKMVMFRRVTNIWEIRGAGGPEDHEEIFKWDPATDKHEGYLSKSILLREIAQMTGRSTRDVMLELERRARYIEALAARGERDYRIVAERIYKYYVDQQKAMEEVGLEV